MQKKRSPWIPLLLAAAAGILTLVILNQTIRPRSTVVALQALAPGTRLRADLLAVKSIPAGGRPADAYSELAEVEGKVLAVGRVAGDPITVSVLSDSPQSGIPSQLSPGMVAIAVKVDQATGVAGILRAGESVTVVGLLTPAVLDSLATSVQYLPAVSLAPSSALEQTPTPEPTPAPAAGPLARIVLSGVRILMVPQSFAYQEVPDTADQEALFASVQATAAEKSVIVLEVPLAPLEVMPGYKVSPLALIAALDHFGELHLGLEPADGVSLGSAGTITLNLAEYFQALNSAPQETLNGEK
jgi:Flp pilus assembly protein CpaB